MSTKQSTPNRKAAEIGFGIEIECSIPTTHAREFPTGSYHHGLPVNVEGFSNWNTQRDGSVRGEAGYTAVEIVSPVLYGEPGLVQVVEMLDYLNSIGAKVNASCGLHVHVDCKNVEVRRIEKLFRAFEVAFYDLNGQNSLARISSQYCRPSQLWNNTRYQSLNFAHAYDAHPHIEIRVWQGAMKPETVVAAIYMAVSLVSRASAPETVKTSDVNRHEPKQVMAKYINRFMNTSTMIVPDYDPHDIWREMMQTVARSNRVRR